MITGFVAGTFDLLHVGHLHLFKQCKNYCDKLIVALQVDPSLERSDKNKPIETYLERSIKLTSLSYVDRIIGYETENDLVLLLKYFKPDIRFLGSDYVGGKRITAEDLVPIKYIESLPIHSTDIRKRIKK